MVYINTYATKRHATQLTLGPNTGYRFKIVYRIICIMNMNKKNAYPKIRKHNNFLKSYSPILLSPLERKYRQKNDHLKENMKTDI